MSIKRVLPAIKDKIIVSGEDVILLEEEGEGKVRVARRAPLEFVTAMANLGRRAGHRGHGHDRVGVDPSREKNSDRNVADKVLAYGEFDEVGGLLVASERHGQGAARA